jgi:hypothetical protein
MTATWKAIGQCNHEGREEFEDRDATVMSGRARPMTAASAKDATLAQFCKLDRYTGRQPTWLCGNRLSLHYDA